MSFLTRIQYLGFAGLVLLFVPFSTFLLLLNLLYTSIFPPNVFRARLRRNPAFTPKNILLTGINTPQGLRLARAFYDTGHNVFGLDYEPGVVPVNIRFSRAVTKFYRLRHESVDKRDASYVAQLIEIIEKEHVDLWLNCKSGPDVSVEAKARTIIERATKCRCFAMLVEDAPHFRNRESFLAYAQNLGLPVPEVYEVKSRADVHNVLHKSRGNRRYTLHSPTKSIVKTQFERTMLPGRTVSQTYDVVSRMSITQATPWRLEQDLAGLQRYSSYAIVVAGKVKAFAASSCTNVTSFHLLDPASALSKAMLQFVKAFAQKQGTHFTSHISIDFCVEEQVTPTGLQTTILPLEVSVRAHMNSLFFQGNSGSMRLVRAYLAALEVESGQTTSRPRLSMSQQHSEEEIFLPEAAAAGISCFGQDLRRLFLGPLKDLFSLRSDFDSCFKNLTLFLNHLLFWQDDAFTIHDPVPFWWSYQVYLPMRLINYAVLGHDYEDEVVVEQHTQLVNGKADAPDTAIRS